MDEGLTEGSSSKVIRYSDTFDQVCASYLAMGMPYNLFWDGEPEAAKYYRQADKIRIERENELRWLQGLYVYDAIGCLQPALNPFSKRRAQNYMEKPIALSEPKKPRTKSEENKLMENGLSFMEAFAEQFNARFKEKQGGESDGRGSGR